MTRLCRILTILLLTFLLLAPALSLSPASAQGTEITPVSGEWKSNEVRYETIEGGTYRLSMALTVSDDGTELSHVVLFLDRLYNLISIETMGEVPIQGSAFGVDFEAQDPTFRRDPVKISVSGIFLNATNLEATVTLSVAADPVTLTAQPTDVQSTIAPRPGRWEGDYEASFEVGEDGLIRDFEMVVPFEGGGRSSDCTLRADDNREIEVTADSFVSFSDVKVKDSEINDVFFKLAQWAGTEIPTTTNDAGDTLVIVESIEGHFTSAEEFTGSFSVFVCGGAFIVPASQGEWSARWVSGGPTDAAAESDPQPGKWQTDDTSLGQGGDFFRIGLSVELDTAGGWDFALINTLFFSVGGTRVAGTWFPERNPDGTFSAVREFPELGNATVTIEGRFVSPTEARGTLIYNDLPPVEWTAGPVEE